MAEEKVPEVAQPSASLAGAVAPIAFSGTLLVLGILGIISLILIAIGHPVFTMLVYVALSAAAAYYLGKLIKVRAKYKPIYILGTFFILLTLCIVAPRFMSLLPPTTFTVTGEAALAQATAGEGVTQSQATLIIMQFAAAGTIVAIAAGRAKTTIQLILLALVAVVISVFMMFSILPIV